MIHYEWKVLPSETQSLLQTSGDEKGRLYKKKREKKKMIEDEKEKVANKIKHKTWRIKCEKKD